MIETYVQTIPQISLASHADLPVESPSPEVIAR